MESVKAKYLGTSTNYVTLNFAVFIPHHRVGHILSQKIDNPLLSMSQKKFYLLKVENFLYEKI